MENHINEISPSEKLTFLPFYTSVHKHYKIISIGHNAAAKKKISMIDVQLDDILLKEDSIDDDFTMFEVFDEDFIDDLESSQDFADAAAAVVDVLHEPKDYGHKDDLNLEITDETERKDAHGEQAQELEEYPLPLKFNSSTMTLEEQFDANVHSNFFTNSQEYLAPSTTDQQYISMLSKLAESMKRSEISRAEILRQRVQGNLPLSHPHEIQSSSISASNVPSNLAIHSRSMHLPVYSQSNETSVTNLSGFLSGQRTSLTSGLEQSRRQLLSYMSDIAPRPLL